MATVFFYLYIFTGSVGRIILLAVPVDTFYRTLIISSSTVLPLNLFVNLFLAPLSLFLFYGPDLGVWPDCWVSAEFLHPPIPRKGPDSLTTTNIIRIRAYDKELRLKLRSININCEIFLKFQIQKLIITSQQQKQTCRKADSVKILVTKTTV